MQRLGSRPTIQEDFVLFIDSPAGMCDSLREIPVVRKEKQPFGIPVESSDRKHPVHPEPFRKQFKDRRIPVVADRAYISLRFVENQIYCILSFDPAAVDFYHVSVPYGAGKIIAFLSVDPDASFTNRDLGLSSRAEPA
jgi:hypothetical protein